ncbi:MAG TPA: FkbM family methyltransferase [Terriglobia bacterium]|nr:FkbM family methyltransferase [Terriglobia bacterium]
MGVFRRLSYRSGVMGLARSLHLTKLLRRIYYRCVTSSDGVVKLKMAGTEGKFYVRTPEELRFFEAYFVLEKLFLQALISTLSPGDVFFDVGCNVGKLAIPVARVLGNAGRVIAFEPQEDFCSILETHLKLNGLRNVEVFKVALGEENKTAQLFVGGGACPSLLPHAQNGAKDAQASEAVEVVEGDWFRETHSLPVPRAVKIDVEGYEYSVLRGLKRTLADPKCELLCLEIHPTLLPNGVRSDTLIDFVRLLGFRKIDSCARVDEILVVAKKIPTD